MKIITVNDLLDILNKGNAFNVYGLNKNLYLSIFFMNGEYKYNCINEEGISVIKEFKDFESLSYELKSLFSDVEFDGNSLNIL